MQELETFKTQLRNIWSPSVAVIASDEAEKLCLDYNGLTTAELLRPYGVLHKMNGGMGVPIRTPAEQPIRLYDWTLHFHDYREMKQPKLDAINQSLTDLLKGVVADGLSSVPDLKQLIDSGGQLDASPWYKEYSEEFFRALRFSSHDAIDHPVACLLVLPSVFEGEASSAFADLFEDKASQLLKQLVKDSHAVVHYAFLHDARNGPEEAKQRAALTLQSLTSSFGPSGHVLTINSDGMPRADPEFWRSSVHRRWDAADSSKAQQHVAIVSALSQSDSAAIAAAVEELAVRKLAPHVEARIRQIDQTALAARKGFKNQLKSLLFRKSNAPATPPPAASPLHDGGSPGHLAGGSPRSAGGPSSPRSPTSISQYAHSSTEAQMRQLSDLAMMVGDCDTALSTLRLLASDYKSDKAYMHYAGVQEAMAAATVLYDGPPSDAIANFKEAYYRYDQMAQQQQQLLPSRATLYATRAAMLMAGYLSAIGRYADASWIVMKAHFAEEDLRAAVLIEQAAMLLLKIKPPRVRKFAFHLVLAGLRYSKGGSQELAARAYMLAIEVYTGRGWEIIEEHVHEALGKGCREGGDAAAAVHHFAATLMCTQIPAGLQTLHMAQFADALKAATAQLGYTPVVDLKLPLVNTTNVGVSSSGQASYANGAARQAVHHVWTVLESAVCPPPENAGNWMDGGSRASLAAAAAESMCSCVGEDVGLDVEIRNPLQIELAVTKLRLSCTFDAPAAAHQVGKPNLSPRSSSGLGTSAAPPAASFQVREERITLHPEEQAVVHLRVKPLRTGTLHIDGVAWELNGIVAGQKALTIKRRSTVKPSASQAALSAAEDAEAVGGLIVKVMPPMPRLELSLDGLPPAVLVGQLSKCTLKLKNAGAMTLHALRCAVDSPCVFIEALQPSQQLQIHRKQEVTVFSLIGKKLGVNEVLEVSVYVRAIQPGPLNVDMCWYYEPLVKLEALPYRTLRATFTASALPSMELDAWTGPLAATSGSAGSGARLLVLRGLNLQGIETFTLKEFRLLGGNCNAVLTGGSGDRDCEESASDGVVLDHVVGPEAAVVLHSKLCEAAEEDSSATSLSQALLHLADAELPPSAAASAEKEEKGGLKDPTRVLLRWEATGIAEGAVQGFNIVAVKRSSDGPGVMARLVSPSLTLRHDFSLAPACTVDLTLELCHDLPANLDLQWGASAELLGYNVPETQSPGAQMPLQQGRRFVLSGLVEATAPAVGPRTLVKVPVRISVFTPGWVSIEGFWVAWTCKESPQMAGNLMLAPCIFQIVNAR